MTDKLTGRIGQLEIERDAEAEARRELEMSCVKLEREIEKYVILCWIDW